MSIQQRISRLERKVRCLDCNDSGGGDSGIQSVQPGTNITVDNTDPLNPIVNSTGGGRYRYNCREKYRYNRKRNFYNY